MSKFFKLLKEAEVMKSLKEAEDGDLDNNIKNSEGFDGDGDDDLDDDGPAPEDELDDNSPTSDTDYSPEDLREIIDYVYEILDKEDDDEENDSVDEIGLDLISDYAEALPQTVINQIVMDLKEMFEIEDTVLESICTEGVAFVRAKKGSIAKALSKRAKKYYAANKEKVRKANAAWRKSIAGKKVLSIHRKMLQNWGKLKGKHLVHPENWQGPAGSPSTKTTLADPHPFKTVSNSPA